MRISGIDHLKDLKENKSYHDGEYKEQYCGNNHFTGIGFGIFESDYKGKNNDTDDIFTLRKGSINLADMKNLGGFERGLRMDVNKLRSICESLDVFAQDYRNGFEEDLKLEKKVRKNHCKLLH